MKTAPWVLMASLVVLLMMVPLQIAAARPQQSAPAAAQPQEDPLAAAALKAREQQKKEGKSPKVWNNDNLPTGGGISVVGQAPAAATAADSASAPATASAAPANPPALSKDQLAGLYANLESAKQEIASLKTDLDISQRKYVLDQQSYYGKTDYASDKAGAAALSDEKDQIDAKQQEIADAQKRLDDLQAQLAAASASSSAPSPASQDSK
jgi:hypothetical protein